MCLKYDAKNTKRYKRTIKDRGGSIVCWKKLAFYDSKLQSIIYQHSWKVGWNHSGRLKKDTDYIDLGYIYTGIHVFKRKPKDYGNSYIFVPVVCQLKDFIASNKDVGEAVFSKVYLKKSSYIEAVKQGKKYLKENL